MQLLFLGLRCVFGSQPQRKVTQQTGTTMKRQDMFRRSTSTIFSREQPDSDLTPCPPPARSLLASLLPSVNTHLLPPAPVHAHSHSLQPHLHTLPLSPRSLRLPAPSLPAESLPSEGACLEPPFTAPEGSLWSGLSHYHAPPIPPQFWLAQGSLGPSSRPLVPITTDRVKGFRRARAKMH